mmetsp:Transcript_17232/g.47137  ORF Transcript_17232/g.47137 Transcript_17232/m.47137 type:complete len:271 (-) Transcript_17232:174-986(-)
MSDPEAGAAADTPLASESSPTGSAPLNPTEDDIPMLIHVTAPASLPAGYTFEAEINGNPDMVITCEVPEGGVTEGQLFLAPLPITFDNARLRAPVGQWKDSLFSCTTAGIFHASTCCGLFCSQIAMGQVITRMNLSWLGEPGTWVQAQRAFKVICTLVASYFVYSSALSVATMAYDSEVDTPLWISWGKFIGSFAFALWSIYSLCRTRETMRARYQIPENHCVGCEDLCCSVWCSCCVAAQMLRHTGEYETYPGVCFSDTGHPHGTPKCV